MTRSRKLAYGISVLMLALIALVIALTLKGVDPEPIAELLGEKYQLQKYVLSNGRVVQLSVSTRTPYPSLVIDEQMLRSLLARGWERCTGPNAEWEATLQDPGPILVHQRTAYLRKGLELLVLHMKYESRGSEEELRTLTLPNSDLQSVTVLVSNEGPLIYLKTSMLGVRCS